MLEKAVFYAEYQTLNSTGRSVDGAVQVELITFPYTPRIFRVIGFLFGEWVVIRVYFEHQATLTLTNFEKFFFMITVA